VTLGRLAAASGQLHNRALALSSSESWARWGWESGGKCHENAMKW